MLPRAALHLLLIVLRRIVLQVLQLLPPALHQVLFLSPVLRRVLLDPRLLLPLRVVLQQLQEQQLLLLLPRPLQAQLRTVLLD